MAHTPTRAGVELGQELEKHRNRAKKTKAEVAAELEWSESKVYRLEHAKSPAKRADVEALCRLYGVPESDQATLVELARHSKDEGWWTAYSDVLTGTFVQFESNAATIRTYHAELPPGLLQTAEYARTVIRVTRPDDSDDEVARRVSARLERQKILDDVDRLEALSVLLDESVIHRCLASGPTVARGQLRALLDAGDRPNVTIRILPFASGPHPCMGEGSFVILDFPRPAKSRLAYHEGLMGDVYTESVDGVARYARAWERTAEMGLTAEASADLLRAFLKGIT